MSRTRPAGVLRVTAGALGLGLALGLGAAGCSQDAETPPTPARPTPIGALETQDMVVPRISFCDLVPDRAVEDALTGRVSDATHWDSGEPAPEAAGGSGEALQEFGCGWTSNDGSAARAWVFARPVTRSFARLVVREAAARKHCRTPTAPPFGQPSVVQVCRTAHELRARHAGLFGDSWLTCEVTGRTGRPAEVRKRADAWCVEVANALDTAG